MVTSTVNAPNVTVSGSYPGLNLIVDGQRQFLQDPIPQTTSQALAGNYGLPNTAFYSDPNASFWSRFLTGLFPSLTLPGGQGQGDTLTQYYQFLELRSRAQAGQLPLAEAKARLQALGYVPNPQTSDPNDYILQGRGSLALPSQLYLKTDASGQLVTGLGEAPLSTTLRPGPSLENEVLNRVLNAPYYNVPYNDALKRALRDQYGYEFQPELPPFGQATHGALFLRADGSELRLAFDPATQQVKWHSLGGDNTGLGLLNRPGEQFSNEYNSVVRRLQTEGFRAVLSDVQTQVYPAPPNTVFTDGQGRFITLTLDNSAVPPGSIPIHGMRFVNAARLSGSNLQIAGVAVGATRSNVRSALRAAGYENNTPLRTAVVDGRNYPPDDVAPTYVKRDAGGNIVDTIKLNFDRSGEDARLIYAVRPTARNGAGQNFDPLTLQGKRVDEVIGGGTGQLSVRITPGSADDTLASAGFILVSDTPPPIYLPDLPRTRRYQNSSTGQAIEFSYGGYGPTRDMIASNARDVTPTDAGVTRLPTALRNGVTYNEGTETLDSAIQRDRLPLQTTGVRSAAGNSIYAMYLPTGNGQYTTGAFRVKYFEAIPPEVETQQYPRNRLFKFREVGAPLQSNPQVIGTNITEGPERRYLQFYSEQQVRNDLLSRDFSESQRYIDGQLKSVFRSPTGNNDEYVLSNFYGGNGFQSVAVVPIYNPNLSGSRLPDITRTFASREDAHNYLRSLNYGLVKLPPPLTGVPLPDPMNYAYGAVSLDGKVAQPEFGIGIQQVIGSDGYIVNGKYKISIRPYIAPERTPYDYLIPTAGGAGGQGTSTRVASIDGEAQWGGTGVSLNTTPNESGMGSIQLDSGSGNIGPITERYENGVLIFEAQGTFTPAYGGPTLQNDPTYNVRYRGEVRNGEMKLIIEPLSVLRGSEAGRGPLNTIRFGYDEENKTVLKKGEQGRIFAIY